MLEQAVVASENSTDRLKGKVGLKGFADNKKRDVFS